MARYLRESRTLLLAWRETRAKIVVFLVFVITAMLIVGSLMWVIEGEINEGFDSIPRGVYWAIVTITTVGYGDITPITPIGQVLACCAMILGYSVIIVPKGVFSAEVLKQHKIITTQACQVCSREGHDFDAVYCKYCGSQLELPGR
jgi:voltage-gated potassium channel